MEKIAFIGIGLMGAPMVANLIAAGNSLTLWNRTREKADQFAADAVIADSVEDAVKEATAVITMLENGGVVDEVLYQGGSINQVPKGAKVIDMSSISPVMAREHAKTCTDLGLKYFDAPVSGGTIGAAKKALAIMVGCDEAHFPLSAEIFNALGKPTYIGPPGAGQVSKLANQAIVGITIGAVSEALLLAAKGGANPVAVREALMGGFAGSKILDLHGQRMIDRNFTPGGKASVQLKDLRNILDEAREQNLTLPLSQRVYEEFLALVASGNDNVDHSGLLLQLEALNQCNMNEL